MIRDITIGQYYNVDSIVHRLDPRVKLVFTIIYVVSLFLDHNLYLYLMGIIMLAIYIRISKVPLKFIIKGLKPLALILLFTVLINMFTVKGVEVFFEWKFIKITKAGFYSALFLGLRFVLMIIGSSMMTYTTTPTALTDGLEKMLGWMKKLGVPVHEFAMIISIALRFVPVLIEELDKIMKAQMARGIDFKEGNIWKRLRKLLPIIVPLFVSSIRRSNELALAMDARCYHGDDGRTKMKPLLYKKRDYIAYFCLLLFFVGMLTIAILC